MPKPVRRIGASKLTTVSECQTPQGSLVALKEFDRQALSAFQHERIFEAAEKWKSLTNPALLQYYEVDPAKNQIVMELMDRSAAVRLSEGHSDPRLVLHTLRGVLAALAYLHEQGHLHVNLKPSNVFFDTDGRVRLSDGLLVPIANPGTLPPPTNQKYLTPEHTSDAYGPMSPASDLYAAGFLALELLAGDRFGRSFQGIGDNAADDDLAWFQWHGSSQEAPSAKNFAKTCPDDLAGVIARLLNKQPAARYESAREVLRDLPQDITVAQRTQQENADKPAAEAEREALSTDVIERPATGVVLAIASGPRAGEMIGTNDTELMIGFDHDCFVRFGPDQYPVGGGKVILRRGAEGWYALRVSGDSAFVNQRQLEEKLTLRSGDIVRLSSRGPDVQFTLQSGGVAIRTLVNRFLPSQSKRSGPAGGGIRAAAAPRPAGAAAGSGAPRPPASAPTGSKPTSPAKPQPVAPSKPGHAPPKPVAPQPTVASAAPKRGPARQPAAGNPKSKQSSPAATNGKFSLFAPQSWSKNQRNNVLLVVGALFVGVLVLLFPTGSEPPQTNPPDPATENASVETDIDGASSTQNNTAQGDDSQVDNAENSNTNGSDAEVSAGSAADNPAAVSNNAAVEF